MQQPPQQPPYQPQYQAPPGAPGAPGAPGGPPGGGGFPPAPAPAPAKKSKLPLILGIGCGAIFLLSLCGGLGTVAFLQYSTTSSGEISSTGGGAKKGGADSIGVPACDEYIKKMEACADKVGGASGDAIRDAAKQTSDAWRDSIKSGGSAAKSALGQGCKSALESSKGAYGAMGCEF